MVDFKKAAGISGNQKNKPSQTAINTTVQKSGSRIVYWWLAAILALTVICFSNALNNQFLDWDDNGYIRDNTAIHKLSVENISEVFSSFYMANYHPLTSLTYMLEYSFVRINSTFLYHLDNLFLHLLNIILVFFFVRKINSKTFIAIGVAALFALHPTRVESVSWISERKDVLYTFFFLLSLNWYWNYIGTEGKSKMKFIGLSLLFFILSLLSKSAAVTLPLVLLLLDYLKKRRFTSSVFLEKLPFFALSALFGYLALLSQEEAIREMPLFTLSQRFFILNYTIFKYIYLSIIPTGLSALHPYPSLSGGNLPYVYYLSPVFNLIIAALLIYAGRKSRAPVFGILFFLVTISLVLQILQFGGASMAERYTYIPYLGIYIIICTYIADLIEKKKRLQLPVFVIFGIVIIIYSISTFNRNKAWNNDISLWDDVISVYPNTAFTAYMDRGAARQKLKDTKGAYEDYSKAILIRPNYYKALINRGLIRYDSANYAGALADYDKGIAAKPDYYIGYMNRGVLKLVQKDYKGALIDLQKSNELKPGVVEIIYNLGSAKIGLRDYNGAISEFKKVLEIDPNYTNAYNKLGIVRLNMNDKDGACREWKIGADLDNQNCKKNFENLCLGKQLK